jgi:hypothetical protein
VAGILNSLTNGININITNAADSLHTVVIRAVSIQGAGSGTDGIRVISGSVAGLKVYVENCFIAGQNGSPGRGIEDFRNNGGLLSVNNTTIINCAAAGVVVDPTASGGASSTRTDVVINNSRITGNGFGANFGSNAKVSIFNSIISANTSSGVFAVQNSGGTTEVAVDHCIVSNNGTQGVNASSANTVIRVSNTTLMNNTTLFATGGGGQVLSYGNNQTGAVTLGTPVAPS